MARWWATTSSRRFHGGDEVRSRSWACPAIIRPGVHAGRTPAAALPTTATSSRIIVAVRPADASPVSQVLIDESLLGWKEFEMEVVRDKADNCIIVCSIENVDPMGVHTGDSITVAPALTLTDREYQVMRNASIAVLREIGVETGGSNVQFAVNPDRWTACHHRDEPARVAFIGAGLKSHGLPDCQGRGQTGHRLHAGRTHQRDHWRRHPRLVRTHDRLCCSPRSRALPSRSTRARTRR